MNDDIEEKVLKFLRKSIFENKIDNSMLKAFQNFVFNTDKISENPEIQEIMSELAYDLDYYESNEEFRREDPSFFGEDKALELIKESYKKITTVLISHN